MAEFTYDIIICGAGPAGSAAALAAASSGLKIALIDKHSFPRDKVCGDAIAAYMPQVLEKIHPDLKTKFEAFSEKYPVNKLRVVAPNYKFIDLTFERGGAIAMRINFDNFLFNEASSLPNVSVYTEQTIKDIVKIEGGFQIQTLAHLFTAKILIGCDGAQGISARKLTSTSKDLVHYSAAVRAYYNGVTGIPEGTFELHYLPDLIPGYFWIFPLPNGRANVGLGLRSDVISKHKINLRKKLETIVTEHPLFKDRFKDARAESDIQGFGLPLGSRKVPISGDHFMLCGDAACLINPLSGEGIGQAVVSGRYAGWQAIKCFEQNDFSATFMKQYDKLVYDKYWRTHRLHFFTQSIINKFPWMMNWIISLGNKSKLFNNLLRKML